MTQLSKRGAVIVFAVFAIGYFLSSLVRGVTATLAPVLSAEFQLTEGQLGLLGGAYFLGFAVLQLPLGNWLDRYGPRRVLLTCLSGAVLSCVGFALAAGFESLLLSRLIGGIGVSACFIAPLTAARLWTPSEHQQSINSWMLMSGSLGLLAATLPVQWAMTSVGWRPIFLVLAVLFVLAMAATALTAPRQQPRPAAQRVGLYASYKGVFADRYFRAIAPVGFVNYGALVAIQTLWAGPWLTKVTGASSAQAAQGLFAINLTMLFVFWFWGMANPRLHRAGYSADTLMTWGLPLGIAALVAMALFGHAAGWEMIALYCVLSSALALTHPAVGMHFPASEAGKAISAFNLLLFLGVFAFQWSVGLGIDQLRRMGFSMEHAYQAAFCALAAISALAYAWYVMGLRAIAGSHARSVPA